MEVGKVIGASTLAIDGTHTDLTINVINEPDKRINCAIISRVAWTPPSY